MPDPETAPLSPRAPSLVVPFALLGLLGAWLTADVFQIGNEPVRWLLVVITPPVASSVGAYLTHRVVGVGADGRVSGGVAPWFRLGPFLAALLVLGVIVGAGILNGLIIGLLLMPPVGMLFGGYIGAICSIPFIPALALPLLAARRVGRARPGSVVDASDRRGLWLATSAVLFAGSLVGAQLYPSPLAPGLLPGVAAVAGALLAVLFLADAIALTRVLRAATGAERGRAVVTRAAASAAAGVVEGAVEGADGAARIDFGLGDQSELEVTPAAHAYRGAERVLRVVQGSRERAAAALRGALARAGVAMALGAVLWARPWW